MGNTALLQEEAGQSVRERVERVVPIPDEIPVDEVLSKEPIYVLLRPDDGKDHPGFQLLGVETFFVHIAGTPHPWAIRQLLCQAPNLKILRITPKMMRRFGPQQVELCRVHRVSVIEGYDKPRIALTQAGKPRPGYNKQKACFTGLRGSKKRLFQELLRLRFLEALLAARYYCLDGESYAPLPVVASEFNLTDERIVSMKITGLRYFLGFEQEVGTGPQRTARGIQARLGQIRVRMRVQNVAEREWRSMMWYASRLGVKHIPREIRPHRRRIFRLLWSARRDGRLDLLLENYPRSWRAITFGFGMEDGSFHTQQEVACRMGLATRAGAQVLQSRGINILTGEES